MLLNFTTDESLRNMDTAIKESIKDIEYWGDLDISKNSLEILKNRTIILLERGIVFKNLFKQYPYAMVSYVVFLVKYKYKGDFWGMISEEIGITKPNASDQIEIGKLILKVFDACGFDYSVAKESSRKYVDSILYEVGVPPESNFGDLFYIFKYGLMSNVDPQILIDEIISKTYGVHKPLLHFFDNAPEERSINFVLDIQDTYLAATQSGDFSNKYSDAFLEWLELDKAKSAFQGKNLEDHVEVKPYFYFDDGKKGLCIVLPRQNMTEEWVESATWSVTGDGEFCVEKECYVQGAEKKRFINQTKAIENLQQCYDDIIRQLKKYVSAGPESDSGQIYALNYKKWKFKYVGPKEKLYRCKKCGKVFAYSLYNICPELKCDAFNFCQSILHGIRKHFKKRLFCGRHDRGRWFA